MTRKCCAATTTPSCRRTFAPTRRARRSTTPGTARASRRAAESVATRILSIDVSGPSVSPAARRAEQTLFDGVRDLLPGGDRVRRHTRGRGVADGVPVLPRGDDLWRHIGDPAQHRRAATARPRGRVVIDTDDLALLAKSFEGAMERGGEVDAALHALGWGDLLDAAPLQGAAAVFGLLGATGSVATLLDDVVVSALGLPVAPDS